jgi:hypothetical protein
LGFARHSFLFAWNGEYRLRLAVMEHRRKGFSRDTAWDGFIAR